MRYFVLAVFYCLLITGCKKADEPVVPTGPQMPERTEKGANILACKVNGTIHVYRGEFSWNHPDGVSFGQYDAGGYTFIKANEDKKYIDNIGILIYSLDIVVGKEYKLFDENSEGAAEYYPAEGANGNIYLTEYGGGVVKFTRYDSLIAAGTFSFNAGKSSGEEVKIAEGFFDISLKE
ncbi:hypothetical protein [Polluticoccus soli]|uniref:hypothetical protein n=1 Tax=Polluticoccus soli TaxID=3034150 RepID=UPI0023E0E3F9|nr:hypothetical protein [Flavipsychrobacter sp. JY13-12]